MKNVVMDQSGLPPRGPKNVSVNSDGGRIDRSVSINKWLTNLGLLEYLDTFKQYKNVQDMLHLTEGDFKQLGVKNGSHRAKMASSLYLLREKLQGKVLPRSSDVYKSPSPVTSNRSTPTHTPPSMVNHPDYASTNIQYQPFQHVSSQQQPSSHDYQLHNQRIISKHLWYHGAIPRTKAETLVKENGDFLVRDSSSQKGDFVLTVYWKRGPLHFVVNRQSVVDPATAVCKVQYQFEEVLCDTVPQLINRYIKEQKPISEASKARISNPINRRISAESLNLISSPGCTERNSAFNWSSSQDKSSHATDRRPKRTGSQPLLSLDDEGERFNDLTNISMDLRQANTSKSKNVQKTLVQNHIRSDSEPMLLKKGGGKLRRTGLGKSREVGTTSSDSDLCKPPPPKPSRVPTVKLKDADHRPIVTVRNRKLYDDEKDYSDYAAVKSWPRDMKRTLEQEPMLDALTDLYREFRTSDGSNSSQDSGYQDSSAHTYDPVALKLPESQPPSKFNLADYDSQILTPNNKPLESSALGVILPMLLEAEAKSLALHATLLDLDLLKVIRNYDLGLGVKSGLELITLPHGSQLRKDTLERFNCMKLFVASTILLCVKPQERAKMVHQWVQAAHCMRNLGNLYGFAYIMDGLQFEQIRRLQSTWLTVENQHQTSFLLFQAKLQSTYKSLSQAGSSLPLQNICLPYILPLVDVLERDNTHQQCSFPWECPDSRSDMGVDIVLSHLDIARIITAQHGLYTVTGRNILGNFRPVRDMLEVLDTRMHLRFLWGIRAARVKAEERYSKYSQILSAMSSRCEPPRAVSMESSL